MSKVVCYILDIRKRYYVVSFTTGKHLGNLLISRLFHAGICLFKQFSRDFENIQDFVEKRNIVH